MAEPQIDQIFLSQGATGVTAEYKGSHATAPTAEEAVYELLKALGKLVWENGQEPAPTKTEAKVELAADTPTS